MTYLGTATPHGSYWLRYFLAFAAAMTAMRALTSWIYSNTGSIPLAQLMHASSTGSLVALSPAGVTAAQEAMWYAIYAVMLWLIVAAKVRKIVFLGKRPLGQASNRNKASSLYRRANETDAVGL